MTRIHCENITNCEFALASLGIESGSADALRYIPVIALFVGLWLLLFYFLKAGKLVTFISTPVMGGFISGIAVMWKKVQKIKWEAQNHTVQKLLAILILPHIP